ncbi:hypothetical protein TNCV_2593081 [Trichonephila clavipes]|nr:hypothetical protein TNCV_2593081 [Trichonephila clavipes]
MAPHTIPSVVRAVCRSNANAGLMHSTWGLHTRIRLSSLLRLKLDSSLKMASFHFSVVQYPRAWHHSKHHSARRLRRIREFIDGSSEAVTCVWMAAVETVGCMRAFLTMC